MWWLAVHGYHWWRNSTTNHRRLEMLRPCTYPAEAPPAFATHPSSVPFTRIHWGHAWNQPVVDGRKSAWHTQSFRSPPPTPPLASQTPSKSNNNNAGQQKWLILWQSMPAPRLPLVLRPSSSARHDRKQTGQACTSQNIPLFPSNRFPLS